MPAVTVLTVISVVTSLSSPGKEGKGDQNNRSSELITVIPLAGVWGATPQTAWISLWNCYKYTWQISLLIRKVYCLLVLIASVAEVFKNVQICSLTYESL